MAPIGQTDGTSQIGGLWRVRAVTHSKCTAKFQEASVTSLGPRTKNTSKNQIGEEENSS
jgi:hypothetical protein